MSGDQLDLDAIFQRSLRVAEAAPVKYEWHAQSDIAILLEVDVPALHQEVRRLRADREMGRTNLAHYSEIIDAQAGENAALRARFRLCSGCDATLARCNEYIGAGAIKCCPDCRHAA